MRFGRFWKSVLAGLCVLMVGPVSGASRISSVSASAAGRVPGRFLVRFEPGATMRDRAALHARLGGRMIRTIDVIDVDVVDFPARVDAIARYASVRGVRYAEPNYTGSVALTPNDPCIPGCISGSLGRQWQLDYTNALWGWQAYPGKTYTAAEKLALPASKVVKVAVVDTKLDTTHNDWINAGGSSPDARNGGQLDLVDAKDFITGSAQTGSQQYHATFVAGILGAAAGNGIGAAGTGYIAQLMPITAVDGKGVANADHVASAVIHAWQKGARVINLSLGLLEDSQAVHDAIKTVTQGANPSLVVAAAGNCGTTDPAACEKPFYPGSYPEVMSVSGTDSTDRRAYCSDYNANVSVSAPADKVVSLGMSNTVMRGQCGTSAAAPQVSGLAAMLFSQNPSRTPAEVRDIIEGTADDRGIPGKDVYFGHGRINIERALRVGQAIPVSTGVGATIPPVTGGNSTITALAASTTTVTKAELYLDAPSGTPVALSVAEAGGGYKRLSVDLNVPSSTPIGPHPIWVRAFDGSSWGPFAVGVLYADKVKPVLTMTGSTTTVVRGVQGMTTASFGLTIGDDYSSYFLTQLVVYPNVTTVKNPPAVWAEVRAGIPLGARTFQWTPSPSIPAGNYRVVIFVTDEGNNWAAANYKDSLTVV